MSGNAGKKYERCRGRKRYMKLLMSCGYPRNIANPLARLVAYTTGLTYQKAWDNHRWIEEMAKKGEEEKKWTD